MNLSDNFKKFMGMVGENAQQLKKDLTWTPLPPAEEVWEQGRKNGEKMKEEIAKKHSVLEETLSAIVPSAEAGDIRQMLGVEPHSGISMQSAAALRQLDKEMEGNKEAEPAAIEEKGKTQKEVFKEVFGEEAATRKKKQQEEEFKRLMQKRK